MTRLMFPSKVDTWLLAVLAVDVVICLAAATQLIVERVRGGVAIAAVLLGLGVVLPAWLLRSTWYELTDTELNVRCGPFRWQIPVDQIRSVTPTHNPLSSPALSLDRLRIEHERGAVMISPRDKDEFLRELDKRRSAAEMSP